MRGFDLVVVSGLLHLLDLLEERPAARPVAGATDFIPFVRAGKWQPELAVDITGIADLRYLRLNEGYLEIGPLVTHDELAHSALVRQHAAALALAAASVGDPQIRARGTIGGNICTASPAADTVPALLALDAEVLLARSGSSRCLPIEDFLLRPGRTALGAGEILAGVRFRIPEAGTGSAFIKLGRRSAMAISIVNAAAFVVPGAASGGRPAAVRLALGSVAPTVVRCREAEAALCLGGAGDVAEATGMVAAAIRPIDDVRATAAYRRAVASEIARRALAAALAAAGGRA